MNKLLLLLLGCAVQSDNRASFVSRITRMDDCLQKAIVQEIQKITEGDTIVVALSALQVEGDVRDCMERMEGMEDMREEHTESDECSSTTGTTGPSSVNGDIIPSRVSRMAEKFRRTPSPTAMERHFNIENAQLKSEMRKLKNEIEQKEDQIFELKDYLERRTQEALTAQHKSLAVFKEAEDARHLRDEVDYLKQKLERLEKYEKENAGLREKLFDMDVYKERVESLTVENQHLDEELRQSKSKLEMNRVRAKSQMESEGRLADTEKHIKELQSHIVQKNTEIERHLSEISRLEMIMAEQSRKAKELEKMVEDTSFIGRESMGGNSLLDEMEASKRSEIADLRNENSILKTRLETAVDDEEMKEWKERAERAERNMDELREEKRLGEKQLNELEYTLSDINVQFKKLRHEHDEVRCERDEALRSLQEARRNFTQFQSEFGRKLEDEARKKIREMETRQSEMNRELDEVMEEKKNGERQLERMRKEEETLRERCDQLEDETRKALLSADNAMRTRKGSEGERKALKEKISSLEDEVESLRLSLIENGDWKKRAEGAEKSLVEKASWMRDLEAENRQLTQQLELESSKTQRMREDLVNEKTKNAEIIGRLRSVCNAIALNGGKIDDGMDDVQMIESIDAVIMEALNAARREADTLRLQQHKQIAELTDLKRDIENLRRSENASLVEVDDRVKELTEENISIKEQVFLLQEKNREQQIEMASRASEITSARREIEQMSKNQVQSSHTNSEVARLQVSLRNLQLQEDLLKKDNIQLRVQLDCAEKSRQETQRAADSLHNMHKALLSDHDRLQNLHDLLSQDYERAKVEGHEMRGKLRNVKPPISYAEYDSMRTSLQSEKLTREGRERSLNELRNDYETLRKEKDCMARNCDQLSQELRKMKANEQSAKIGQQQMRNQMENMGRELHKNKVEMVELRKEIELLIIMNRQLKEESRELFRQNEDLIKENHELHNRLLRDKDERFGEQKQFQERLNELHRHQERLEGKIMEQYKNLDNVSSKSKMKQPTFVKRTVKALIPKKATGPGSAGSSTTEESSNFSADEAVPFSSSAYGMDEAILLPTSSSSEENDRFSPRYESIERNHKSVSVPPGIGNGIHVMNGIRPRNGLMGGSVRVTSSSSPTKRIAYSNGMSSYHRVEEEYVSSSYTNGHDSPSCSTMNTTPNGTSSIYSTPLSSLPPRAPIRGSSVSSSMRIRPPPPPYNNRPRPPPYPSNGTRTSTPITSSPVMEFKPQASSTPKSERSHSPSKTVVKEGEQREFIREKEERLEKSLSIYENVDVNGSNKVNESTVWYEYGCV